MGTAILVVLSFFAIYGVIHMIVRLILALRTNQSVDTVSSHRILMVRDAAESIEGMIRPLAWQELCEEVIVIDLGSHDETADILNRLSEEYSFLSIMTLCEYQEYLVTQSGTIL